MTYDLHENEPEWNIRTEHEGMFTEMGIKIKALIARKKPGDDSVTWIEPKVLKRMARCLNNLQDEYGSYYCAQGSALDEDEMARYLSCRTAACPFFEPGDEYKIVAKQN